MGARLIASSTEGEGGGNTPRVSWQSPLSLARLSSWELCETRQQRLISSALNAHEN